MQSYILYAELNSQDRIIKRKQNNIINNSNIINNLWNKNKFNNTIINNEQQFDI